MSEISDKVRAAGVVGAGGAGFPTHVKLSAEADTYIVNAAECEPLLKSDQQLAKLYPELLVDGLANAMKATKAKEGIIAIKEKYKDAIKALTPKLAKNMRIEYLRDVYPAGDEVITIWMVTGRRVPPGGIPLNIGVVVNNVLTLINVSKAMNGIPVTDRTITVTGGVSNPVTVTVPIGTSFREVVALAGGAPADMAYIDGGPVMGNAIFDLDRPVMKTSGGLIALPADHTLIQQKIQTDQQIVGIAKTVCEQCSMCTELCPRHIIGHELPPHLIVRSVNYGHVGNPQLLTSALTCSECGVCEVFACPVNISPRRVNVMLKKEFWKQGIKYQGKLGNEDPMAEHRLIPSSRIVARLGLKDWYREAPLQADVYAPTEVKIPLKQHIGAPSTPVVKLNDEVKKGDLIGEIPENALGARIHASIDGKVVDITQDAITIRKGGGKK